MRYYKRIIKAYCVYLLVHLLWCINACSPSKKVIQTPDNKINRPVIFVTDNSSENSTRPKSMTGEARAIQEKYAKYLNMVPDSITNIKLYVFIDKWLHTPYKWGGTTEKGIDCSAFVQRLYNDVYGLKLPRTSATQIWAECVEAFKSIDYLSEGDLVFFKTVKGNQFVTHVGIYLHNNIFVNSSSSKGVSLGSLDNAYWKATFVAAGRIKAHLAKI